MKQGPSRIAATINLALSILLFYSGVVHNCTKWSDYVFTLIMFILWGFCLQGAKIEFRQCAYESRFVEYLKRKS